VTSQICIWSLHFDWEATGSFGKRVSACKRKRIMNRQEGRNDKENKSDNVTLVTALLMLQQELKVDECGVKEIATSREVKVAQSCLLYLESTLELWSKQSNIHTWPILLKEKD